VTRESANGHSLVVLFGYEIIFKPLHRLG